MIHRCTDPRELGASHRGAVVAIGNFDGVHRGHQAVLDAARSEAARREAPLVCLTFEPHPRSVFRPDQPVPRLTPAPMKARLLDALGFDAVVEHRFDRDVAKLSADAFVAEVLVAQLAVRHVVVGFDFQFGAYRLGTPPFLVEQGAARGFGVTVVEAFVDEGGAIVSSSRIREDLGRGEVAEAAARLGYRWTIEAPVVHGQKIGRTLGYPTANMAFATDDLLAHGIYAIRFRRADGTLHDGVASYGRRPTFDNGAALFETYLFDFSGDLYGETAEVSLFAFLRGEEKFDGVDPLIAQMDRDAAEARAFLAGAAPLSPLDSAIAF
ncbi:bifunctional riboflavin kinase/FAD synthetase [Aureimonas sp. SA4125]|uniref:bifunctional riboflavin kinase/FAD synthetase n=1 Tax=Aureimonas sp. SA4125 TaxID=2826993 RepID=UPI001CC3D7C3|nr:bifunctional riboflavin kinase/FAD synthetase [Aureimonas sp. SA4125]